MRAVAAVALALACLASTLPAEAKPLPQTTHALRTLARDVVSDLDREVRGIGVPAAPPLAANGAIEMRMGGTQPVVRGAEDFLAVVWVGARDAQPWTGAYWVEANGRAGAPAAITLDREGGLLFLDAGVAPLPESVDVSYHFLGADGARASYHLGVSRVLDHPPIGARADFGLALASASGHEPEALLFTPWNTLGGNASMAVSYMAGDEVLAEYPIADCDDFEATTTSAGCRLTYVDALPPELTTLVLWHAGEDGARVIDRALTLDELVAGYGSAL